MGSDLTSGSKMGLKIDPLEPPTKEVIESDSNGVSIVDSKSVDSNGEFLGILGDFSKKSQKGENLGQFGSSLDSRKSDSNIQPNLGCNLENEPENSDSNSSLYGNTVNRMHG